MLDILLTAFGMSKIPVCVLQSPECAQIYDRLGPRPFYIPQ